MRSSATAAVHEAVSLGLSLEMCVFRSVNVVSLSVDLILKSALYSRIYVCYIVYWHAHGQYSRVTVIFSANRAVLAASAC
jgi:hypothetical protein